MTWLVRLGIAVLGGCTATVGPGGGNGGGGGGSGTPALVLVAQGLDEPVFVTAPAGDPRLFVVEKTGRVRIVRNDTVLAGVFLDLSTQVSGGGEQGLLSLAFHPDYAQNGRVYASYTNRAGDTRVVRYTVSADPERVDPSTADTVLALAQPYANHNGGLVAFGPDGFLYVGLGDGGAAGDPLRAGQDLGNLLGKLLRLDVDRASGYGIPAGNPFVGQSGARGEIWSYGLRNPWRFAFDRLTGDLYIADVGQGQWEEIDVAEAADGAGRGVNYGWNVMEGAHCYAAATCSTTGLTLPLVEYSHAEGCSVTGGYVYRGSAVTTLRGHYFYADYCAGWIRSFRVASGVATDARDWTGTLDAGGQISSFGEDAAGELYVMTLGGRVWRIAAP
jgi:hypothetical protein